MSPVVRIKRLELLCPFEHNDLNVACKPIPAYPHIKLSAFFISVALPVKLSLHGGESRT